MKCFDIECLECAAKARVDFLAPWRCPNDPTHEVRVKDVKP